MPLAHPKRYTAKDYWALPEGKRAELIDGVLYSMTPPGRTHQKLSAALTALFFNHIASQGGTCEAYSAPFAVNLAADDTTWIEPDVLVVCDPATRTTTLYRFATRGATPEPIPFEKPVRSDVLEGFEVTVEALLP